MKKTLALLLVLALVFAQTESEQRFEETTGGSSYEIFKDWKVLSVLAILTSLALIGIAFAIGTGLEMPEVKAWAGNELVQAIANVVIIICFVATIALLDAVSQEMVQSSGLDIPCTGGQSCIGNVAVSYIDSYLSVANEDAKKVAIESIKSAGWANRRFGLYCTSILCLQVGTTFSFVASYVMDQDRYTLAFEYYSNLIASLEAQKFFINSIGFSVGPLILAAGIVARSFFLTRKLGGLLMALAAGIMFFFPAMYVFDWVTLDTTLTGNKANQDMDEGLCPDECKVSHPLAVVDDGSEGGVKLGSAKDVYDAFPDNESEEALGLINGTESSAVPSGGEYAGMSVISCMVISNDECPLSCRELPYPTSIPQCMNRTDDYDVQENCAQLPDMCWLTRVSAPASSDEGEKTLATCPADCKVIPPLKGNCSSGSCLQSRPECRVYEKTGSTGDPAEDFSWAPNPPDTGDAKTRCEYAKDCMPDYDAFNSCAYVVPLTDSCTVLCEGCDEVCRVITANVSRLPDQCDDDEGNLISDCRECPDGCKVNATHLEEVQTDRCIGCDAEKRIVTYGESMPEDYVTGACDMSVNCTPDERVSIPRNSCEQCLFSDESEMYSPAIQTGCTDLCRPSDDIPAKDASAYTGVGGEGLVGTWEIQNISKLMLPGYLLPLFNLVATFVFIKGLSTALGGDIEIPGISKVF